MNQLLEDEDADDNGLLLWLICKQFLTRINMSTEIIIRMTLTLMRLLINVRGYYPAHYGLPIKGLSFSLLYKPV